MSTAPTQIKTAGLRPADPENDLLRVENLHVGFGEKRNVTEIVHGASFSLARASAWRSSASPARARASPPAPWSA